MGGWVGDWDGETDGQGVGSVEGWKEPAERWLSG